MHNMDISVENYLETIYRLKLVEEKVFSVDIARFLSISRPSVSNAIKKLANEGYIEVEKSGNIVFTKKGRIKAEHIYEKHIWFKEQLVKAGLEKNQAEIEACKLEHAISYEAFEAFKGYIEKLEA